jgi:hypothetical protein
MVLYSGPSKADLRGQPIEKRNAALRVQPLQGDPAAQPRRLLRVLLIRLGQVPANPATARVLWIELSG